MKLLPLGCYIIINLPPLQRFSKDVQWMTGRKLNLYWQITWRFVSPLLLIIVFMAFVTLQIQKPPSYAAWNPEYVCSWTFSKLFLKARILYFCPLPDPLKSLLSTTYLCNSAWSDTMFTMRGLRYAERLQGYTYWNYLLITGPLLKKSHIHHTPLFRGVCDGENCWSEISQSLCTYRVFRGGTNAWAEL